MKIHHLVLALGALVGTTVAVRAQEAKLPPGPLEALQDDFGKIVGDAFRAPDAMIDTPAARAPDAPGPVLGRAVRTSMQIPGAIFAAPYAAVDPDANAAPAPAAKPAPRHHRHARGYHHPVPGTAG